MQYIYFTEIYCISVCKPVVFIRLRFNSIYLASQYFFNKYCLIYNTVSMISAFKFESTFLHIAKSPYCKILFFFLTKFSLVIFKLYSSQH